MRLTRSLVGKDPINLDMPEWAFRVLVEVAHLDVADALTVQGVLLNPIFLANSHRLRILKERTKTDIQKQALALPEADQVELAHAPLTALAFRKGLSPLGSWEGLIVLVNVLLFATSTAISWSYYGDRVAPTTFSDP